MTAPIAGMPGCSDCPFKVSYYKKTEIVEVPMRTLRVLWPKKEAGQE